MRRASDGKAFILPTNGSEGRAGGSTTGLDLSSVNRIMNAGDWDRDGHGDLIVRQRATGAVLYRGNGKGRFAAGTGRAGLQQGAGCWRPSVT